MTCRSWLSIDIDTTSPAHPPQLQHTKMSRSYLGNNAKHATGGSSSHRGRELQAPRTTHGKGGGAMPPTRTDMPRSLNPRNDTPSWPTNMQQPRFGQQMPQPPMNLGYDHPGNQNVYGGGYANPPPPTYYTEGYSGSSNYPPAGRFMAPPYGQRPVGWGNPYQYQQDRPPNEAMDIDDQPTIDPRTTESLPRRRSPARPNPRRDCKAPTSQRRDIPSRSQDLSEEYPISTTSSQGGSCTSTRGKAKATTEDINH